MCLLKFSLLSENTKLITNDTLCKYRCKYSEKKIYFNKMESVLCDLNKIMLKPKHICYLMCFYFFSDDEKSNCNW